MLSRQKLDYLARVASLKKSRGTLLPSDSRPGRAMPQLLAIQVIAATDQQHTLSTAAIYQL